MSPNNKGDLAAPGVDKTGPAGVQDDVFSISCTEADGRVVKWLSCVLKDCREHRKIKQPDQNKWMNSFTDRGYWSFICLILWTHSFCEWPAWWGGHWDASGAEQGCQSGPGGGTRGEEPPWVKQNTHYLCRLATDSDNSVIFRDPVESSADKISSLPLIHILEHTTRSVRGGEDTLVRWNSRCCEKLNVKILLIGWILTKIQLLTCIFYFKLLYKQQQGWKQIPNLSVLTVISRVNPLGQEETAELVLSVYRVLDFHQVRRHAERIVRKVAFTVLATTGYQ